MEFLPKAFEALNEYSQFIIYLVTPRKGQLHKMDKLPADYRTGGVANAMNPEIWTTAKTAIEAAKRWGHAYGVGFVFTKDDPFFFLDIDSCLDVEANRWNEISTQLCGVFEGAAVEISNSKRGLHIFGKGEVPTHSCKNADFGLELYTQGRFVALTGNSAYGDSGTDCTAQLSWLVASYFPVGKESIAGEESADFQWTTEACEEWSGNADDEGLLKRALASKGAKAVFGRGATFRDLWEANEAVLTKAYPPTGEGTYDGSTADMALAQHLAFWTGKNCERMLRMMEGSALKRDKWEREDYLPQTIRKACERQKEYLIDRPPQYTMALEEMEEPKPILREGTTFLTVEQQMTYFSGCVYVLDEHKVMIKDGYLLTPDRFKSFWAGYVMPLDAANVKTTRNAFEAFTESQAYRAPRAHSCCFLPNHKEGSIIIKNGQNLVNIYFEIKTPRVKGDVTLFLNHIAKLFPVKRDQEIIIAYLAAIIQHKGVKFQWCPLIQGVEGNGKTFLTRAVAFAIGDRYSHFPKAAEIANKFNDWLYAKIFIGVEDIYLFDAKTEVFEALKPMLTSERQEIEPKGGAKVTRDICANFLINTNHKEGLRKTRNDRRFAPFYTAQQSVDDFKRDGMDGDYFTVLYDWAEDKDGYAMIADFLENYPIPAELNPAVGCKRAPITSSTEEAIEQGIGAAESEVLEVIEEGRPGFRNGWVSSRELDNLLKEIKRERAIPRRKRRAMMQSLGYDWHPALKEGRATKKIQPYGDKPALYIKHDHQDKNLTLMNDIAEAYAKAQADD